MTVWTDVENACAALVTAIFPSLNKEQAYQNGPEQVTPYCEIDLMKCELVSRENSSTLLALVGGNYVSDTKEVYEATVRFSFIGRDDRTAGDNHGGNLAHDFSIALQTPPIWDVLDSNQLSLMRKDTIRRVPKPRETAWYNSYNVDVVFAYSTATTTPYTYIDNVTITGHYLDSLPDLSSTITIPHS